MTETPPEDPRDSLIRRIQELGELVPAPEQADLPGRKPPRKVHRAAERAEQKRNQGKQPGSPGAAMRWRQADKVPDHFPEGACGLDLSRGR